MKKISSSGALLQLPEYTWKDVREEVTRHNPVFAAIIDKLNPGKAYTLFKGTYPYGRYLLKEGKFYLPCQNGTVIPLDHPSVPSTIQTKLGYNAPMLPMMLGLNNAFEMFVPLHDRIIPFFFITSGNLFGISKILDEKISFKKSYDICGMWEITAGARNAFIINKITEKVGHEKLQRMFDFTIDPPTEFRDQWQILCALYQSPNFGQTWEAEALFFSAEWFNHLEDPAWKEFKMYLLEYNWKGSEFWRSQYIWDIVFSRIQAERISKPNSYHSDLVRQLFAIAAGGVSGFRPVMDDQFLPAMRFQEVYLDIYGSKHWYPIMVQPAFFSLYAKCDPVYYSLQYQTASGLSPKSSQRASAISDIYQIAALLEKYRVDIQEGILKIENTPLFDVTKYGQFDFYHSDPEDYSKVLSSHLIPEKDLAFTKIIKNSKLQFPKNSQFFNGCVSISKRK